MEKYFNVFELTDTMEEGLIHIRNQVNEGYFEASFPLVRDVVSAFASIENSVWGFDNSLQHGELVYEMG